MIPELWNLIRRGRVNRTDPSGPVQLVQFRGYAVDPEDRVEHIEPFGFTSHAPDGAEAVALGQNGSTENAVVIVVGDRRHRLRDLGSGEVAIHDAGGRSIVLRSSGTIEITGDVTVTGDLTVEGDITSESEVQDPAGPMSEMRQLYNVHTHGNDGSDPPVPQQT